MLRLQSILCACTLGIALFTADQFQAVGVGPKEIAPECRVANVGNGFCGWCAVETLGRHHNIAILRGLTARKLKALGPDGGGAWYGTLTAELSRLHVGYRQLHGHSFRTLRRFIADYDGVVVLLSYQPVHRDHFVAVVGFDAGWVYFINSNHVKSVRRMSRAEFSRRWDGGGIAVLP